MLERHGYTNYVTQKWTVSVSVTIFLIPPIFGMDSIATLEFTTVIYVRCQSANQPTR